MPTIHNRDNKSADSQTPIAPNIGVLVNRKTMASLASVSTRTIDKWVSQRRIPAVKLGAKCIRFQPDAVLQALARFTIKEVA